MSPPSLQELLSHADFVRRVAAATVGEHLADDVVQETYLAALRRPPRSGSRVRAWLATVARNAGRMVLRERGRRRVHERGAARPDQEPSTVEAVSRVEMHGRVVAELLELDEPYRLTVIYRYFDNLPPREIARIMGIPTETVRVRLRRALKQLRGRMDRRSGKGWALVLLPALETRSLAATTGAAVMTKKTATVVVAWAVLATGLYVNEATGRAPPVRAPAPDTGSRAAREAPVEPDLPAVDLTPAEEMAEFQKKWQGSRTALVRGQVQDRKRQPFRAVVQLELVGKTAAGEEYRYEVTSDADGSFAVPDLRYPLNYRVHARASELGVDDKSGVFVVDPERPVGVRVQARQMLAGQVVDEAGRPIPGAATYVRVQPGGGLWTGTVCDARGRFRSPLRAQLREGQSLRIAAVAPGYLPGWSETERDGEYLHRVTVVLKEGPRVRMRLLDADGAPYSGKVLLYAGRTYPVNERPADLDPNLAGMINLEARMTDQSRGDGNERQWIATRFMADENGNVDGWLAFAPETLHVVVARDDAPPWIKEVAASPRGTIDLGTHRLAEPAAAPRLRLLHADGTPVARASVRIRPVEPTMNPLQSLESRLQSDAEGWVRSGTLALGERYRLIVIDTATNRQFERELVLTTDAVVRLGP